MERYLEFVLNHYILSLALAVVTYMLIQEFIDTAFKKHNAISPLIAVTKMNEGGTVVVDVREPDEFSPSHIEDAINLPLSKIPNDLSKIVAYKDKAILLTCQNGSRSASAAKLLSKAGYEQIFVITGGMQAWENDYKYPVKLSSKKNKPKPSPTV